MSNIWGAFFQLWEAIKFFYFEVDTKGKSLCE
jgi:hypothetical protein